MAFDANDLSPHEHFVVERTRLGDVADFTPMGGADGSKPNVRAGFLRKLMLGLETSWTVQAPGVRLRGARIDGALDLTDCSALPALSLENCDIAEPMDLSHARLARLSLRGSAFVSLKASATVFDGPLDLSGARPARDGGEAWIAASGARIGGDVIADGAQLAAPAARPAAEVQKRKRRYALHLRGAQIGGSVWMSDGFKATGGVNLDSATIGGSLLTRGVFVADEHDALRACGARITGDVTLGDGFHASGGVTMQNAEIGGDVRLAGAKLDAQDAPALDLAHAAIGGALVGPFKSEGALRLVGARIGGNLDLQGADILCAHKRNGAAHAAEHGRAIDAANVRIGGAVIFVGANVRGETLLAEALIAGGAAFGGGRFINGGGWAINAASTDIGGDVALEVGAFAPHGQKTVIEGGARFDRARIAGGVVWRQLELRGPGPEGSKGAVLSFADARIGGALRAHTLLAQQDARIDVSGVACAALDDDVKKGWGLESGALNLEGFAFGRIDGTDDRWRTRLHWLKRSRRDGARFSPQPFAHLAQAYARAGRREDARRVLLAQHDLQTARASSGPLTWALSSLFGVIAGYGLAPVRIVRALALFLALGVAGVLAMNAQGGLVTPEGRACNATVEPALYAIDVALPIDLGYAQRCAPGRTARADLPAGVVIGETDLRVFEGVAMWRWAHALYALLGAILAALAVITFSGVLRPRSTAH